MNAPHLRAALLASVFALGAPAFASAADRDGYLYTGYLYDDRYSDSIFTLDALKPFGSEASRFRPYGNLVLNLDSQTLSAAIPATLTDNYALAALGLQYANGKGLRAYAQGGLTARVGALAAREPLGDVRTGVQLFRGWGGLSANHAAYGNFFGQATYFSRDRDAVLSNQIETGRALGEAKHAVDLYVRGAVTVDSHSFYYANTLEGTVGFRVRPLDVAGITVSVEKSFGAYLRNVVRPPQTSSTYQNFRFSAAYGLPF